MFDRVKTFRNEWNKVFPRLPGGIDISRNSTDAKQMNTVESYLGPGASSQLRLDACHNTCFAHLLNFSWAARVSTRVSNPVGLNIQHYFQRIHNKTSVCLYGNLCLGASPGFVLSNKNFLHGARANHIKSKCPLWRKPLTLPDLYR